MSQWAFFFAYPPIFFALNREIEAQFHLKMIFFFLKCRQHFVEVYKKLYLFEEFIFQVGIQDNPLIHIYPHAYRTPPNQLKAKHTHLSSAIKKSKTPTTFNRMMRGLAPAVSTIYLANDLFIIAPSVNLTLVSKVPRYRSSF